MLDSNCMVAAVSPWHEHHDIAREEIDRRLDGGEVLVAPAPALVEAYAVLTRLPAPHRLSPADAWTLVNTNFIRKRRVVALQAGAYTSLLTRLATDGVAGGRSYDKVIAECARKARVTTLLTFNTRHFDPPPSGVDVVVPSVSR
jgi:predicted nucleic acid-binding protein